MGTEGGGPGGRKGVEGDVEGKSEEVLRAQVYLDGTQSQTCALYVDVSTEGGSGEGREGREGGGGRGMLEVKVTKSYFRCTLT